MACDVTCPGRKERRWRMNAGRKTAENGRARSETDEGLMDMKQAIAALKTSRPTFYRWLRTGKIKGMKVGRQWRFYRSDIEAFLRGAAPRVELAADIAPLTTALAEQLKGAGVTKPIRGETKIQQVVSQMIALGLACRASDIHITSHMEPDDTDATAVLRYRVDGVLHVATQFDIRLLAPIVEQWKRMAAGDVHEIVRPQDGRIKIKVHEMGPSLPERALDLRASFLPAALGESVTLRILDKQAQLLSLEDLPYGEHDRTRIAQALHLPWGLVICTGPTGSGKTTTLYACLKEVTTPEKKVLSLEDPVEYLLPWVTQVPVRTDAGVTFDRALRSFLRADPDVIMVGEIRDLKTIQVCIQAALTGHLVLTTLHTEDAVGALRRMRDMGVDPFLVGGTLRLVIAQRLVRTLCPACKAKDTPNAATLAAAEEKASRGGLKWSDLPHEFMKPVGCPKCARSGYRGRTVVSETLEVTSRTEEALRTGQSDELIREVAVNEGMITMAADGVRRFTHGETTFNEISRVLSLR